MRQKIAEFFPFLFTPFLGFVKICAQLKFILNKILLVKDKQMPQLFDFLQQYSDYIIIGLLLLMSIIMLAMVIERYLFLRRVNVSQYSTIHALDIDLNRNMTVISTIGANAPYVGLLGTVIGILLTFYQIGNSGGDVDAGSIMMHLSLALKATALGILVAIPSMVFYNGLGRKVEVNRLKWKVLHAQKDKE